MKKVFLLLTLLSLPVMGLLLAKNQVKSIHLAQFFHLSDQFGELGEKKISGQDVAVDLPRKAKTTKSDKPKTKDRKARRKARKTKQQAVNLERKSELTPAEIRKLELARKRERRKNGYAKSDSPSEYAKFQQLIRTKEGAELPEYEANYKLTELYKAEQASSARRSNMRESNLAWSERGPANVPGRTRGLLIHPADSQRTWFAGSASGGVWKTTDAGGNWVNKTPNLPNLATTTLAMSPSNPSIIYAGTGEAGFFNTDAVSGDGIFKSVDGGETWQQLSATAGKIEFKNINRIIVDPTNANVLLVCTNVGLRYANQGLESWSWILRSVDGGNSWAVVAALSSRIQQLVASPHDFKVQYATVNGVGVIKSTDGGQTWVLSNKGMYPGGRIEMAIAPTNPSRLYASAEGAASSSTPGITGSDLYMSDDAGANWQLVIEAGGKQNINWLGSQGWYDNTIMVHPFDQNTVYLGGIQLWKTVIKNGEGRTPNPVVTDVEEVNTQSFLDFTSFGGQYFEGKLVLGNAPVAEYVSVEIRFGPGKSQKAHRFTVGGREAGVPAAGYIYRDYVDVPFEAWDITNNRQLMVSFRDQQEDSTFNLLSSLLPDSTPAVRREYIYIQTVPYAETPNDTIAQNGGHTYKQLYFLWPILKEGATWDPDNLPESKLVIRNEYLETRLRVTEHLTDGYQEIDGKNEYVHVDQHNLLPIITNPAAKTFKILNANDGGVYVTKPDKNPGEVNGDWIFAGNGYNTTQFYGADKKRDANEYIGGTQDNGTWRSAPLQQASAASSYLFQLGGDGFEVSWNYYNPNKIIGSSQFNGIARTINGGTGWTRATNGLTDVGSQRAPFISQIGAAQANPDVLYTIGASGVWISDNFGEDWKLTPIQSFWGFNGSYSDVKVSLANTQIVWAGNAMSSNGRIQVSTDGGRTFKPTSLYTGAVLGNISGLATHPTEDSTAYALFSFANSPKVLRTRDLGQTWEDISGFGSNANSSSGFPDVAVYSLLVMPHEPNVIWAGTEIGLVASTDGGSTWALAQNGLPSVSIWELKVVDDQVVVATHGRGIWSVTIPQLYQEVTFVPYINNVRVATNGNLVVAASLRSDYDSTLVYANGVLLGQLGQTSVTDTTLQYTYTQAGLVTIQLKSYKAGKVYVSTAKDIEFFVAEAAYSYVNTFNALSADFFGNGFAIKQVDGFQDGAIHSIHPYKTNTNDTYQLKTPIVVAKKDASFKYKDVVIVEPGEPGAPFGSPGFYDYVIVEGSKDGLTWTPLEDGYNADYNAEWRNAYDNGLPGHDSLFVEHEIDLLQSFTPGDTVFFRFRLYSDPVAVAWGWAIDNLSIQEEYKAVTSFILINADRTEELGQIADNDTINLNRVGNNLNIRATTHPEIVGSVVFELDGKVAKIENLQPYALAGDYYPTLRYYGWTPTLGTHTLKATSYSEPNGKGMAGEPLTVTFTVIKVNGVDSFVLVNAETGQDIGTLQDGDVIDLDQVGRKLNVRASTYPQEVGSVVFELNGKQVRTESIIPYALAGDYHPVLRYYAWEPPVGKHVLRATPYSAFNGKGATGIPAQVSFSVKGASSIASGDGTVNKIVAYPNPGNGKLAVELKTNDEVNVTFYVYDFKGNQVLKQKAEVIRGATNVNIDISAMPKGMYFLKAVSDKQTFDPIQIVKQQ